MANYESMFRSNYFKVKDGKKYHAFIERFCSLTMLSENDGDIVGFYGESMPSHDDEDNEVDFVTELATHLADGQVAILTEAGNEKARYNSAYAIALDARGETIQICIDDIYEQAKAKFGVEPTRAEY